MGQRGPRAPRVVLSDEERETLQRWARRHSSAQALATRCRIVLACAEGGHDGQIAERVGVSINTVGKWRRRSSTGVSMVFMTSPGQVSLAASATTT